MLSSRAMASRMGPRPAVAANTADAMPGGQSRPGSQPPGSASCGRWSTQWQGTPDEVAAVVEELVQGLGYVAEHDAVLEHHEVRRRPRRPRRAPRPIPARRCRGGPVRAAGKACDSMGPQCRTHRHTEHQCRRTQLPSTQDAACPVTQQHLAGQSRRTAHDSSSPAAHPSLRGNLRLRTGLQIPQQRWPGAVPAHRERQHAVTGRQGAGIDQRLPSTTQAGCGQHHELTGGLADEAIQQEPRPRRGRRPPNATLFRTVAARLSPLGKGVGGIRHRG